MGLIGSLCYYALRKLAEKAEEQKREQLKQGKHEDKTA